PDLVDAYGIEWASVVHHGVIDQMVDRPEGRFSFIGEAVEIGCQREVRAHGKRTAASVPDRCDRFVEELLAPSCDDHRGAFCGQAYCYCSTNSSSATSNERHGAGNHRCLAS